MGQSCPFFKTKQSTGVDELARLDVHAHRHVCSCLPHPILFLFQANRCSKFVRTRIWFPQPCPIPPDMEEGHGFRVTVPLASHPLDIKIKQGSLQPAASQAHVPRRGGDRVRRCSCYRLTKHPSKGCCRFFVGLFRSSPSSSINKTIRAACILPIAVSSSSSPTCYF